MKNWEQANDNEIVCYCKQVTKKAIVEAIQSGNNTLAMIQASTQACTGNKCKELNPSGKCCSEDIAEILNIYGHGDSKGPCCSSCCCK